MGRDLVKEVTCARPYDWADGRWSLANGYASIASRNQAPSTTLTGGSELVVGALLEAWCHLESLAGDVCLVLADESLLSPFDRSDSRTSLAIAFCLSTRPDRALARISDLRRDAIGALKPIAPFGSLHVSAAIPLLEAIAEGRSGPVALEFEGSEITLPWCVDVENAAVDSRT